MKIFVTGATGTIGSVLVSNLLESGHEITIITRDKKSVEQEWKDKVSIVEGLTTEKGDWLDVLVKHDAVVNLVGENVFGKRWTAKQKERIYNSRVLSTENIVNAIQKADTQPSVLVSVSGADYYPPSKERVYTEDDEPGGSFLSKVTKDWEAPLKNLDPTKTRTVIFRMGVTFTYNGGGAERMFLPHKFFVGGWIGSGSQIYSWIHITDFVGLLQWGIENNHVEGIYNGVSPEYRTMKELAIIGGKIMHRWTWTWAPGFMLKLILGERANIILKGRVVSSKKVIEAGYEFKYIKPEEALEDILEHYP